MNKEEIENLYKIIDCVCIKAYSNQLAQIYDIIKKVEIEKAINNKCKELGWNE